MSVIHFYDAICAGRSPAEGQIVRYDSLSYTGGVPGRAQELGIRLREDVHVDFEAAADSELAGIDLHSGMTELEWAKVAHQQFSSPHCLHIGLFNSTRIDPYIRFGIYRNLLPYPCLGLPPDSRFLDLETLIRAIYLLRPDEYPYPDGPSPFNADQLHHFLMWEMKVGGGNRAMRIRELLGELHQASPRLVEHALGLTSVCRIKTALGLDQGEVSDLDSVVPNLLVHSSLVSQNGFVLGMPVGIDITYPDILFVADLQADLSLLCDPRTVSYQGFVRQTPSQVTRPLVRVPLSRFPFCAPLRTVRSADALRLGVDVALVKHNISLLRGAGFIPARLKEASILELASQPADVYHRMWAGDFSARDRDFMADLHSSSPDKWLQIAARAHDSRFYDLAVRLLWREAQDQLSMSQMAECTSYGRSKRHQNSEPPLWVAQLVKQAQDANSVLPGVVGLVRLHDRITRNTG